MALMMTGALCVLSGLGTAPMATLSAIQWAPSMA
jgi:hypothetical protein